MLQIFCTLRYYASGSFQAVLGDAQGIHKSSVSRIITRVTFAICRLRNRYIKFPRRRADMMTTKQGFYNIANLAQVLAAVDGTLMPLLRPKNNEHLYVSRKGGHSINVLATCNADLVFTNVVAKHPGSTNDSYIWSNCNLHEMFEAGDFGNSLILGDSGFGLSRYLLTPVLNPSTEAEERYNSAHKRTRQVIERSFGLAKQRFRCLHKSGGQMMYSPEKCCRIVLACFILHNICVQHNIPLDEDEDEDEDGYNGDDGDDNDANDNRSEERRVGKECRSRWSPYH
jgi:hypothetical protein